MFCIFSIWLTKTPDKIIPNETCIIQEYLDKVRYFFFNSIFKFIIHNSIFNCSCSLVVLKSDTLLNRFEPSVTFHIKTCYLIWTANQMSSFYMKCNTGLKTSKMFKQTKITNIVVSETYSKWKIKMSKRFDKRHISYMNIVKVTVAII